MQIVHQNQYHYGAGMMFLKLPNMGSRLVVCSTVDTWPILIWGSSLWCQALWRVSSLKIWALEQLHQCWECGLVTLFFTPKISYLFFQPDPWNWYWDCKRWDTTNNNPPGQIKPSSQSVVGVSSCYAFRQPQNPEQKCWAKTILLSQTSIFWLV